jgi:hypothetical protein
MNGPASPTPAPPKRIALSWIGFLAVIAAVLFLQHIGGLGNIVDAVFFAISGVIFWVQALVPGFLPMSRILPAGYALTNRVPAASRAYGTRFDRISGAVVGLVCFYAAFMLATA